MATVLLIIVFIVILAWLMALSIFLITQLKNLQQIIKSPQVLGFKYWSLIRFNPFRDTGSNQSFVLCLLDEKRSGVILTSMHSRNGTRMYAKLVKAGHADTDLSEEEQQALSQAHI